MKVERFLIRDECSDWLRSLVEDREAWGVLSQAGSAASALLVQSLFLRVIHENSESRLKRKRKKESDAGWC
jgi:hypothetical protein